MTDLPRPTIIRGSRTKAAKVLAFGLVFEALGVWLFLKEVNRSVGAILAVTCLYLVVQGVRALVSPPELEIGDDGLRWRGARPWQASWRDIKEFTVWRERRAQAVRIIYFSTRTGNASRGPDVIPNTLWMEPDGLAELLNARLVEARATGTAQPVQADADVPDVPVPVVAWPTLSLALVAVLAAVFSAECLFPLTPPTVPLTPSTVTLAGMGGLGRNLLTGPGQWYRFVTAPFLHGGPGHLLANGFALFLAGRLLEGVVGLGWFAAIYVVGALAGGYGSLLLNSPNVVSVGASGAIVALFAAAFVCSFHYPRFGGRQRLQSRSIAVLLPTLFAVGRTTNGMHIDFGAHLGGAVGGMIMGGAILLVWRAPVGRPRHQRLGAAIGFAGLLASLAAVWPVAVQHDMFSEVAILVPDTVMPHPDAEIIAHVGDLLPRYPHDPRLHLAAAMGDMERGDPVQAAVEARIGLHDMDAVRTLLEPLIEADLWLVLGESSMQRGANAVAGEEFDRAASLDAELPGLDFDRGELQMKLGNLDRASLSAVHATHRQPSSPPAWRLLGDVRFAQGSVADALAAYRRENDLSSSPSSFRMTGLSRFYTGDPEGALFDLKRGRQDGRVGYYSVLWLDIVSERAGQPRIVDDFSIEAGDRQWPAPLLSLFLGTLGSDAVRDVANSAAPASGKGQICEADFYIAEWTLIHGDKTAADSGLRRATEECPPDFVETWMAKAELAGDAIKAQ